MHAVAMGAPIGGPVTLTAAVDRKYRPIFLQATNKGEIVEADISLNDIEDIRANTFPEFLESFETRLGRKRMLSDDKVDSFYIYHAFYF